MSAADDTSTFCRLVRARSQEHRRAVGALQHTPGVLISLLRQELDSMVRVIFLLHATDRRYRASLVRAMLEGKPWQRRNGSGRVTDREMVKLADALHGWTESVYRFGCAFIHLSRMHDYQCSDPMAALAEPERTAILGHLRRYHGGPGGALTMEAVVPLLPAIFEKIASNLECYVTELEGDRTAALPGPRPDRAPKAQPPRRRPGRP